jgi:hypothetical protein
MVWGGAFRLAAPPDLRAIDFYRFIFYFSVMGLLMALQKTVYKEFVSKSFCKRIDKTVHTPKKLFFFSRFLGGFSARGVRKHQNKI